MKISSAFLTIVAAGLSAGASAQDLPSSMTWSANDLGTQGYIEASAIADAFSREYGARIRVQPSGSSIGRLQPVLTGRANVGFLATETFFAAEGTEDFAAPEWGPQDIRVLAGRNGGIGMVTTQDSGADTIEDLRGMRVALTVGNPSNTVKCEAILSFGGLTFDDIDLIMYPTYSGAQSSLANGEADATCGAVTASAMYELEASSRGIKWLPIPADDEAGWQRLREVVPMLAPFEETVGPGISEENPAQIVGTRYPILVVQAEMSDDEAYALTKALDETYDLYKDATSQMPRWQLSDSAVGAIDAPFHPGAIRYLEETGLWTDEQEAWNEAALARIGALQQAWDTYTATADTSDVEAFTQGWLAERQNVLTGL